MWDKLRGGNTSALVISAVVHGAALLAFSFYKITTHIISQDNVVVETVLADDRTQQEFDQDLSLDTRVSENLSMESGGMVSTGIAGIAGTATVATAKIAESEVIKGVSDIKVVTIGDITIPGVGEMGLDLGEGQVKGETGARVAGYGAAMSRITQELTRMMRKEPVIVVWLFDASNSLRDDRVEIRNNVNKIYEELKIAQSEAKSRNVKYSPLETMVCSFGADVKELMPSPSGDLEAIRKAIDSVADDDSGKENTFGAIQKAIDKYGPISNRTNRKLVVVVVTDESGDDDAMVEDAVVRANRYKAPVYFMGREAIFGYPYAHVRWVDPEDGLTHWIRVDRGPETAFPECLQYDGLHGRWDAASSGFGPYGQVRLAKESGGIFFMLATEEKDLIGRDARGPRKFDDLAMKEYEPILTTRREYEQGRNKSEFRSTIWQVIVALNPHLDGELNLKRHHWPAKQADFMKEKDQNFSRCLRSLVKLNEGVKRLEKISKLREKESEPRWRAAYDLALAQLMSYRVRQFQYLLLLDQYGKNYPPFKKPESNEWNVGNTKTLLEPTPEQVRATKVDMKELEEQKALATKLYNDVIKNHPGTPWARRAQQEKDWGFGFVLSEGFRDPKYNAPRKKPIPKF
ncbi:MAG TPA: VWA domain-containing protein [Planctomicrobium sp.]|nr:VWA domain-containing protein [Planctomicrobium sp.]